MKRKICLFLSILMVLTIFTPASILANEDAGLKQAIETVKTKFNIPENLTEFNYNVRIEKLPYERTIWDFDWSSKNRNSETISVSIDDKGFISYYYFYEPYNRNDEKKFPKYSKKECKNIAEKFIKQINPNLLSHLKYVENYNNSLSGRSYYFNYIRIENNVPSYSNKVGISVNKETGKVTDYHCDWTNNITFSSPYKAIATEKAQKSYIKNLGVKLIYKYSYEDDKIKLYPVYVPKFSNAYNIDALTGKVLETEQSYYCPVIGNGECDEKCCSLNDGAGMVTLSPLEQAAVKELSNLLSKDDAEKIARETKILNLTKAYKLSSSELYKIWLDNKNFVWNLEFTENKKSDDEYRNNINVCLDAQSGEIISFSLPFEYDSNKKPVYTKEQARKKVETFLKNFNPEKYKEVEYSENNVPEPFVKDTELQDSYGFRYIRKVGKAVFPDNYLSVRFDAIEGKIVEFDMKWFDVKFPSLNKVLSLDTIYKKIFNSVDYELQYKEVDDTVKLVYSFEPDKREIFDAYTGNLLTYNGKPYEESKPITYNDINGHPAEKQITMLAEYGIGLEENEFKPDEQITQKDFFRLFTKALNYYGSVKNNEEDINNMYDYIIRQGILKENEKSPDSLVKKQDCVKYIVRTLKYDKVADLHDIFICPFEDIKNTYPEFTGYVAIVNALGIIGGDNNTFNPEIEISRADTAVIIYNFLQK